MLAILDITEEKNQCLSRVPCGDGKWKIHPEEWSMGSGGNEVAVMHIDHDMCHLCYIDRLLIAWSTRFLP